MRNNTTFQIFVLFFLFLTLPSCIKENEFKDYVTSATFYQPPKRHKTSVFCELQLANTGKLTILGKHNTEKKLDTLNAILFESEEDGNILASFFSDDGTQAMFFNIFPDNTKDSLVIQIKKLGDPDSTYFQVYLCDYDWDNNTVELLYTYFYDASGLLPRGTELEESIDDFLKWLETGRSHPVVNWAFKIAEEGSKKVQEFGDKFKELFKDIGEFFGEDSPVDGIGQGGEKSFDKENADVAPPNETDKKNDEIEEDLDFQENKPLPPYLNTVPKYRIQKIDDGPLEGIANSTLLQPLRVKVTDTNEKGVAGIKIKFYAGSGSGLGYCSPLYVYTDAQGIAQTNWTLGSSGFQSVNFYATDIVPLDIHSIGQQWFEAEIMEGCGAAPQISNVTASCQSNGHYKVTFSFSDPDGPGIASMNNLGEYLTYHIFYTLEGENFWTSYYEDLGIAPIISTVNGSPSNGSATFFLEIIGASFGEASCDYEPGVFEQPLNLDIRFTLEDDCGNESNYGTFDMDWWYP